MMQKTKIVAIKMVGLVSGFGLVIGGLALMTIKSEILVSPGVLIDPVKTGFFVFGILAILFSPGIFYWTGRFMGELEIRGTATPSIDIGEEYKLCGIVTVGKLGHKTHFLTLNQGDKVTLLKIEGRKLDRERIEIGDTIARTKKGIAKISALTPKETETKNK